MRKIATILVLISLGFKAETQEFSFGLSYDYIYSKQIDESIQMYNFSRPLLTEKQPIIMNGLNASIAYVFSNEKHFKHGINLSCSYFNSSAENENLNNTLNLYFLNVGYVFHYENVEQLKGFYTDLIISATSCALFRKVNGEPFVFDEAKSKAFGIGADLSFKAGYSMKLKNKIHLSPFILFGYTPYFYSPNTETVINQTKGLASKNWTGILNTQVGLTFHLKQ